MKYPKKYGTDRTPKSLEEMEMDIKSFINTIREINITAPSPITEKSFWIGLENDEWAVVANSVKEEFQGALIQEYNL